MDNVTLQAAGIGHDFSYGLYLSSLQGQPARHDKADISGTEDYNFPSRKISLQIDKTLRRARREYTCRAVSRNIQCTAGTLPAAHCKDDCLRSYLKESVFGVYSGHFFDRERFAGMKGRNINYHCIEHIFDPAVHGLGDKAGGIFRTCKFFAESVQAKSVVNALVQNSAQFPVALQNENTVYSVIFCGNRCCQPGGAASDNYNIISFHTRSPPVFVPTII